MKKVNSQSRQEFLLALVLVVAAVGTRLLFAAVGMHNFNAVYGATIFAGACLTRHKWGYLVPFVAMLISDAFLGFYDAGQMSVVYASFAVMLLIGTLYAKKPSLLAFTGVTIGGSVAFFLLTNFALWPFYTQYPHTWGGIVESYTLALPFFKNTFASTMLFSAILFGGYEAAKVFVTKKIVVAG
ncbi:MAG TPA: DUF6580 family putative transport protein [Candidatus Kapabacteria bacterium]|nr:DUF6580 family putative transport protein [Candidatus Kapabacteria bacterium]